MPRNTPVASAMSADSDPRMRALIAEHSPPLDARRQELVNTYHLRLRAQQFRRLPQHVLTTEQMRVLMDTPQYSVTSGHWAGLWRSSADEATPRDAYSAPLQVLPEMIDGSIGQGSASHVSIEFVRTDDRTGVVRIRDNGRGIQNTVRLKHWAAYDSVSNIHRNGHGLKKSITKFAPDFETAVWTIVWKNGEEMGVHEMKYPFVGMDTPITESRGTAEFSSGTEITIVFEWDRLGKYTKAKDLIAALKEIIRTRYSEEKLVHCRFTVKVQDNTGIEYEDSHAEGNRWHSFEWHLNDIIRRGNVEIVMPKQSRTLTTSDSPFDITWYKIARTNDLEELGFPNYGKKQKECALVHVKLNGRTIEMIPFVEFMRNKGKNQDTYNGNIVMVDFTSADHTKMPSPCTTKVSLNREMPIYKEWFLAMHEILNQPVVRPPPAPVAPRRNVTKDAIVQALGVNFRFNGDVFEVQVNNAWIPAGEIRISRRT